MLIRVDGRHDGVKEYLEHGRKKDREFSRDELDERVVLAGDLELTDAIVQSIDAAEGVDRYLSITLSFKEDEIDVETMRAIVREFEAFVFRAYRPDEYSFYAEAHLPRIKSYVDRQSGTLVERKPHIHVVLPKLNLIAGQHLEPLGYVKSNIDYIDAFQEHINAKYGLASPKDNRRMQITDASEMISRYKGDLFGQASRELKERLLDAVLDREIKRYEDFLALLAEHGAVRMRNAGREDAYPNVKPAGEQKGVNLKEHVFSREFIELPTAEKRLQLATDTKPEYAVAGHARAVTPEVVARLHEWVERRAREVKYLNNAPALKRHQQLSPSDQLLALAQLERGFYAQHLKAHHDPGFQQKNQQTKQEERGQRPAGGAGHSAGTSRHRIIRLTRGEQLLRRPGRLYEFKRAGVGSAGQRASSTAAARRSDGRGSGRLAWRRINRVRDRQPGAAANRTLAQAGSLHALRNLSGVPVVRHTGPGAMLLPDHASRDLEHGRAESTDALRRPVDREPGLKPTGRAADTELEQLARDGREGSERARDATLAEFALIRQQLDPRRLLAELSHSHGVLPEKYPVVKGRDGSERIQAGTRKLNVSDFLTKELNLPWREASQILRASYARQVGGAAPMRAYELPRAAFWRDYVAMRDAGIAARRQAWADQRASEKTRRGEIRQDFTAARVAIAKDPELRRSERRAALSVARMDRAQREMRLSAAIAAERDELKGRPGGQTFEAFLRDRAQQGDERALEELRRARREPAAPSVDGECRIYPAGLPAQRNEILFDVPAFTWEVSSNGDVVYRRDDVDTLRDEGDAIQVLQFDRAAIEAGLRLAQGKFGRTLELAGGEASRREAAKVAAEAGIYVEFSDPALNDVMNVRRAELVASRLSPVGRPQGDAQLAVVPRTPGQPSGPDAPASDKPKGPTL
ncbi:LPD7 domain-containing protein [Burkholderia pseudomallei]|uniref:LPD7 domain-containing protein n=1 Tax=Burkholderia pseudomallei TaxID=28450 RepID=UPI0005387E53|nr:LPD7 domain-containing protein [Burkholderia pseudomallei]KGX18046.1 traH domain protein [Burkholderia pseudomallei ABCPW 1]